MSNKYGKALSAFKKVNRIRSASQNIDEARLNISKQQLIARQKAEDLVNEKNLVSNAFDAAIVGGTSLAMSSNMFNEGKAKEFASVLSAVKDIGMDVGYSKGENRSSIMAGLGSQYDDFKLSVASSENILGNALSQYTLFDQLEKKRKSDFFKNEFGDKTDEEVFNQFGKSKDVMRNYMEDNVEYQRGKGYSIDVKGAIADFLQKDVENRHIRMDEKQSILDSGIDIVRDTGEDFLQNEFVPNYIEAFKNYNLNRKQ